MANSKQPSRQHQLVNKANGRIVAFTSVAAFIVIFSLVAIKELASQASYQNRVISKSHQTLSTLKSDLQASTGLQSAYNTFVSQPTNVIGGSSTGNGPQDGDNAKVVLDALPSSYDFPALTSSLEEMLNSAGVQITSITGTDDEAAQASNVSSATPQAVPIPFQVSVSGNYASIQKLVSLFEHSIRPFQIQSMQISGDQNALTMNITAQTFYQPAKTPNISSEVVK